MTRTLTPTEERVFRLRAEGLTIKEVAARTSSTEQSVKNHISSVYDKLGVDNLASACRVRGWLTVPGSGPAETRAICGWVGECGRFAYHSGHHGGFRPVEA